MTINAARPIERETISLPAGIPPLQTLYMYIAGGCNLACRHCWITPKFDPDGTSDSYLKLDYARKAVVEAKSLGLNSVKLTGGEPTLHPQFRELVSIIADEGIRLSMETNAMLIDQSLAELLREKEFYAISASLDGAKKETHDYMRAVDGSYERTIDGIKALVAVGMRPQMICTLHKGNVAELEDVIALAESLGCGSVKFNHVQRVGRGKNFGDKYGLELTEILALYDRVHNVLQPRSKIRIFFDVPYAFLPIREFLNLAPSCMVHNILGVLAGGEISMCGIGVTTPDLVYGHIEKDDLRDVWLKSAKLTELRELVPQQLEGVCGNCLHRRICRGHCIANTYFSTGKMNSAHRFCSEAFEQGLFPESRLENPELTQIL